MATDLDDLPIYDQISKSDGYLTSVWVGAISRMIETLQEFMGQYGMFVPQITTAQRDAIQSPQNGQIIYNTTLYVYQQYDERTLTWWNFGKRVTSFTTAERDALSNVENGIIIYNTTTNKFQGRENSAWVNLI
jgi:hypothetical protein